MIAGQKSGLIFTDLSKNYDVIGIDEVQFFDRSIVKVCKILAYKKKRVIAAGLDTDYLGQPFGPARTACRRSPRRFHCCRPPPRH